MRRKLHIFIILILNLLLLILPRAVSLAATYYVDATNGDNSNNGLSEVNAWKTISNVYSMSFNPGDNILFKRGELWREQLNVPSSGSAGNPITFGAYGSGGKPVISGADLVSGWSDEGGNVWKASVSIEPYHVFFDEIKGTKESSMANLDSQYEWYWESNILYVYSTSDPDTTCVSPGVEAGARQRCILISDKEYIAITDIDTKYSGAISYPDNILIRHSSNVIISGGTSSYGFGNGILIRKSSNGPSNNNVISGVIVHHNGDSSNEGNGIGVFNENADNNKVINCITYSNQGDGIVFHGDDITSFDGPDNGYVANCVSYDNGEQGIEVYLAFNTTVEYNECYENRALDVYYGQGIKIASPITKSSSGNIVRYNYCHDNEESGIVVFQNEGFQIYNNLIINSSLYGISIGNYDGGTVYNNVIYNSTRSGMHIQNGNGVSNIIIKNNIISGSGWNYGIRVRDTAITKVTSDYNLIGDPKFGSWAGSSYVLADWRTNTGQDTNSIVSDPLFANPSGNDFHLQSGSLAIDTGTNVGLAQDFDGNIVPQGNNPDMGAYEYLNQAPVADAGSDQTVTDSDTNSSEQVTLDGSGSNDADGSIVSYTWHEGATQIVAGVNPTVVFSTGTHTVTLTVTDNNGATGSDTVIIGVNIPGNNPPTADDQSVSTPEDTPVTITLTGSDPDNDPITYSIVSGPSHGTLTGTAPNLTYTPNADYHGADSFTFLVNDGILNSNNATVTITVNAGTDPEPPEPPEPPIEPEDIPTKTEMNCYNNVFNPTKGEEATIHVELDKQAQVTVVIYDNKGKKIKTVVDEEKSPGFYTLPWNGKDDSGNAVGSGIYIVHIQAGGYTETKKIAVVK